MSEVEEVDSQQCWRCWMSGSDVDPSEALPSHGGQRMMERAFYLARRALISSDAPLPVRCQKDSLVGGFGPDVRVDGAELTMGEGAAS
jgi:hypothetical protein